MLQHNHENSDESVLKLLLLPRTWLCCFITTYGSLVNYAHGQLVLSQMCTSTVKLQYNGHPPSAAKMPVYWSLPLFMDPFSNFIIKMVSSKNDGILDFAAILGRR